ncbi:MAG: hypothetical protein JNL57_10760 [Bacteroidetes bacterium]|nr:hypothetical protein [Bacteroidota bacterium]
MKIHTDQLKKSFISRLRTQERAYNDIGIYYTPRLYAKLCKNDTNLKNSLKSIYDQLILNIKIRINPSKTILFSKIDSIAIENNEVYIISSGIKEQLMNFKLIDSNIKYITLDHKISFYNLIKENLECLPNIKKLTADIRNGQHLSKEKMRKEYHRVSTSYQKEEIEKILEEVMCIAKKTELELMPSHLNFSKGKK